MLFGKCQIRSRARLCSDTFSTILLRSTGEYNSARGIVQASGVCSRRRWSMLTITPPTAVRFAMTVVARRHDTL